MTHSKGRKLKVLIESGFKTLLLVVPHTVVSHRSNFAAQLTCVFICKMKKQVFKFIEKTSPVSAVQTHVVQGSNVYPEDLSILRK